MRPLAHHLHRVRSQPPHVRKQVTFALAAGATALIALVWLVASLTTGAWHIQDSSFANAGQAPVATDAERGSQTLAGAAAAAFIGSTTPAHLEVVSGAAAAAPAAPQPEQTVIPF